MNQPLWFLAVAVLLSWVGHAKDLRFSTQKTFKIVQFTDLHFGEDAVKDTNTVQVMRTVLAAEKPDLVALSGDMVSGYAWDRSSGWYEQRWKQLLEPLEESGVPFAAILGNHDDEADLSRRQIIDLDHASSKLSLTQQGPEKARGASNYRLPILSSDGSSRAAAYVWMLDSMDRGCGLAVFGWGCVGRSTIQWLKDVVAADPVGVIPSLAFIHIPLPQFRIMWNTRSINGTKTEPVNCPSEETGVFRALRDSGIHAVYSGHDHNNDFVGALGGVRLAYGRKSGYGSYGPPQGWQRGARVILLREGESTRVSETWLRLEDEQKQYQGPGHSGEWRRQLVCWPG